MAMTLTLTKPKILSSRATSYKTYVYKLRDETGKIFHGFTDAASTADLRIKLRQSKYYFISAVPYNRSNIFKKHVSLEQLLMFTHRFTSLIETGIPILTVMSILWRQTDDKTLQLAVCHMRRNLEEGKKISEALEDFPNIYSIMYRRLIEVAEKAGKLPLVMNKLSDYLENQKTAITRLKKALLYPALVIVFVILILIAMFMFVVPTFQQVLVKLKVELPLITQLIVNFSGLLRTFYFLPSVALIAAGLYFAHKRMMKNHDYQYKIDELKLKLPIVGDLFYLNALSRFTHSLSILLSAGLPAIESFEISKTTTANKKVIESISAVQKQVEQGTSLYESFQESQFFPIMFVEMIGVGESSGTFVKNLDVLAAHFDEELDYKINKVLTILEPLLIIAVGGIVLLTMLAIYMPILSVWQGLSR